MIGPLIYLDVARAGVVKNSFVPFVFSLKKSNQWLINAYQVRWDKTFIHSPYHSQFME